MGFTAAQVIGAARHNLADPSGHRWSDSRFYPLINEALYKLRNILQIEELNEFVVLQNNVGVYDLSAKVFELYRVEHNNQPLPLRSYQEMDNLYGSKWQTTKGSKLEAIVYNLHKRAVFTTYPIYQKDDNSSSLLVQNSLYGGLVDIEQTLLPWAIVPSYTEDYGAINLTVEDVLRIYYTPVLGSIDALTDTIPIQDEFLEAIANFCAGRCLEDNTDRLNLANAQNLKSEFFDMIQTLRAADARAHVNDNSLTTGYNPMR